MSKYEIDCKFVPEINVYNALGETLLMWNAALMSAFFSHHYEQCKDVVDGSCFDMDDLVQEMLMTVLHASSLYKPGHSAASPQSYAWVACENKLTSLYRTNRGRKMKCVELNFDFGELDSERVEAKPRRYSPHTALFEDVVSAVSNDEECDTISALAVQELLTHLRRQQRGKRECDTLIGMLVVGNTQAEIASALGSSQPTVSAWVSRLRKSTLASIGSF